MSTSQAETLRDIAQLASDRHGGAGGREMQRIAEAADYSMAYTTFNKFLNGTYAARPSAKTLESLAYLAGVPVERVYDAAGRDYPTAKVADMLPPDVDNLTIDQRNVLVDVARAFLKTNKELEGLRDDLKQSESRQAQPDPQDVLRPAFGQHEAVEDDSGVGQKSLPDFLSMAAMTDEQITKENDAREQEWAERGEESQETPDEE